MKLKKNKNLIIIIGAVIGLTALSFIAAGLIRNVGSGSKLNNIPEHTVISQATGAAIPVSTERGTFTSTMPEIDINTFQGRMEIFDPRILVIEINQSLSYGVDSLTGESFLIDSFVSGKETAVFVELDRPAEQLLQEESIVILSIYINDELLINLAPFYFYENVILYMIDDMRFVDNWSAGEYLFEVRIGDLENDVAAIRETYFHETVRSLKVLAVPVITNYGNDVILQPEGRWKTGGGLMASTFPVARADVEYILGPEVDLSFIDLSSENGKIDIVLALSFLFPIRQEDDYDLVVGIIPEPYTDPEKTVLGWMLPGFHAVIASESDEGLQSTIIHEIGHAFGIGDEYFGGALNLYVNPPPYGVQGRDMNSSQLNEVIASEFENVQGYMNHSVYYCNENCEAFCNDLITYMYAGAWIHQFQRPFNAEDKILYHYASSYMGGGLEDSNIPRWVTSDIWLHKFAAFTGIQTNEIITESATFVVPNEKIEESIFNCPQCFRSLSLDAKPFAFCNFSFDFRFLDEEDIKNGDYYTEILDAFIPWDLSNLFLLCAIGNHYASFVDFMDLNNLWEPGQGFIRPNESALHIKGILGRNDTFENEPWFTFESNPSQINNTASGEYSIRFFDNGDQLIYTSFFNAEFHIDVTTDAGREPIDVDFIPINTVTRFPANTTRVAVWHDEKEIFTISLIQDEPTVAFTGLVDNQSLTDTVKLTWEAGGTGSLTYDIWYHPREGAVFNIASKITGTDFEADLSNLPGTHNGFFTIEATNGVRSGSAISSAVSVPYKAPIILTDNSVVYIKNQTEYFIMDINITDLQDGRLWDNNSVYWTARGSGNSIYESGDVVYQYGSTLRIPAFWFSTGDVVFTVNAVNSEGQTAQADFHFEFINDMHKIVPFDWSVNYVVLAAALGFNVNTDNLDLPVLRYEYARDMITLYGNIHRTRHINFGALTGLSFEEMMEEINLHITDSTGSIEDRQIQYAVVAVSGLMEASNKLFNPLSTVTEREAALLMWKTAEFASGTDFGLTDDLVIELFKELEIFDDSGPNIYRADQPVTNRLSLVRILRFAITFIDPDFFGSWYDTTVRVFDDLAQYTEEQRQILEENVLYFIEQFKYFEGFGQEEDDERVDDLIHYLGVLSDVVNLPILDSFGLLDELLPLYEYYSQVLEEYLDR